MTNVPTSEFLRVVDHAAAVKTDEQWFWKCSGEWQESVASDRYSNHLDFKNSNKCHG